MKVGIAISTLLLTVSPGLHGQSSPAPATTPVTTPASAASSVWSFPSVDGTLHYALSAAEIIQFGFYGGGSVSPATALSGDISYNSKSTQAPFTMLFAGGVIIGESSGQGTTTYLNLAVSQNLIRGKWVLGITDSVSYLPQSPTTGLSGIPGVGDIGAFPVDGPSLGPAGGILSYYGSRVSNDLSGSVERLLTGKTSVSGTGSWTVLHFLENNGGYDSTQVGGQAGLNHRLDARNTISVNGAYSVYTFGKSEGGLSFTTTGVNGVYSRVISRSFTANVSAGPQWVSSSNSALIPDKLNVAVNAALLYTRKVTNAGVTYTHGVSGGSGVQVGGLSDSVTGFLGHSFGPDWLASATGAYVHTDGLGTPSALFPTPGGPTLQLKGKFSTVYGGLQVTRSLGRHASAYVSYTAQHQSYDAAYTGTNAFKGTSHTLGIGISYTPRATRLGQF